MSENNEKKIFWDSIIKKVTDEAKIKTNFKTFDIVSIDSLLLYKCLFKKKLKPFLEKCIYDSNNNCYRYEKSQFSFFTGINNYTYNAILSCGYIGIYEGYYNDKIKNHYLQIPYINFIYKICIDCYYYNECFTINIVSYKHIREYRYDIYFITTEIKKDSLIYNLLISAGTFVADNNESFKFVEITKILKIPLVKLHRLIVELYMTPLLQFDFKKPLEIFKNESRIV
ncbi:hypothetical protein GVAV_003284 [Gurleya vavrai]